MQYEEQVSGQIDVPADTASATVYTIEFGTVALLKCLLVKNGLAEPVGIRFGSAVANEFVVGPGGVLAVAMPTAPASGGLAAMKVVTTDEASADGAIEYLIFGDPTPVS